MLSYDEIIQKIVELRQTEVDHRFTLAALCMYAVDGLGIKAGDLAHNINASAGYVRQLVKVHKAFPTEESRLPYADLTFQHFKLCAYSDRPGHWAAIAVDQGLSTRELSRLMKGEAVKDELKEADRIYGTVERAIQAGGKGARYLYDRLVNYLRGVDLDDGISETAETEEEETTDLRQPT